MYIFLTHPALLKCEIVSLFRIVAAGAFWLLVEGVRSGRGASAAYGRKGGSGLSELSWMALLRVVLLAACGGRAAGSCCRSHMVVLLLVAMTGTKLGRNADLI